MNFDLTMPDFADDLDSLTRRLREGDPAAAGDLFTAYRERLKRMVRLRLDRRVQGRLHASDVLQEAFLDVQRKAAEYAAKPGLPAYLWMRLIDPAASAM